jgi:hypothetical protein
MKFAFSDVCSLLQTAFLREGLAPVNLAKAIATLERKVGFACAPYLAQLKGHESADHSRGIKKAGQ